MELTKIYGQLFITKNGSKDNGAWFETLKKLTPKALESGMERLKNLPNGGKFAEFPPNCLQFKGLCLAFYESLNLPKASEAYQEIKNSAYKANNLWSHPIIEFIAHKLPHNFFLIDADYEAYPIFKVIYEEVCNLVKQGHQLPKLTEKTRHAQKASPLIARTYLNQMRQQLGMKQY